MKGKKLGLENIFATYHVEMKVNIEMIGMNLVPGIYGVDSVESRNTWQKII